MKVILVLCIIIPLVADGIEQPESEHNGYVVVNFLSQLIFVFPLFLGMIMYPNEVETKEK